MKTYKFLAFLFLILLFQLSFVESRDPIFLVKDSQSTYSILISDKASVIERESAQELQKYIEKIAHYKLPIMAIGEDEAYKSFIFLGTKNDLRPHQIAITSDSENIEIAAGSPSYLKYAVYEFLEIYLDCSWLSPEVEIIPQRKTIEIPSKLKHFYEPSIHTRTVHSELFYGDSVFAKKMKVTTEAFPYYAPEARVHTFNKLIPESDFFEEHPEYFAWRNNRRQATQLCLSNPEVLAIVKDSVNAIFMRNPLAGVVSVSTNDNTQYCTCENCARIDSEEGSPAGSLIRFVNEVAKEHPEKQISTLAYQYTRKPCKTKPLPNVLITLCSIECDRSAPIEEKCTDFAEDLKAWKELSDNIRIWDYTTQFTNFLAPFPNIRTLQANLKFFSDNNAKWVFEQHSRQTSELFELRSYLLAKLLWNPIANLDSLITKFTDSYYGVAGPYVKEYVDIMHDELAENEDFFLFLYGDPSQAFDSYLRADLLTKYEALFDAAEEKVGENPDLVFRIRKARLGLDYSILEASRKQLSEKFKLTNRNYVERVLSRFVETTEKGRLTSMNEMRFLVSEYIEQYRETIALAAQPNKANGKKVVLLSSPKKYANEDPQTLTDGSFGGSNFYANWLGFEGNDLHAVIDLGSIATFSTIRTNFLQVSNHIVFFPVEVEYYISKDGKSYQLLESVPSQKPLTPKSKVNDIQGFEAEFEKAEGRYIKIIAKNKGEAPMFHHAAGLPAWIFADEIIVN